MDVIIAARLSQKSKKYANSGIETQDEDARDWAKGEGHNVIATVADHASGTKAMGQRKNLRPWVTDPELMAKYQGIVAAKQDRLSRADWRDEAELRIWAETNGKTLFIVDRDLRWPPREGVHHDDVTNWNRGAEEAHLEWNTTSRRYKRMLKNRIDNNELTGRPPYGYRSAGVNCGESPCRCWEKRIEDRKTLAIYEPEARIVREAKDLYLSGGTLEKICDDFNGRGIPSPVFRGEPGSYWWPRRLGKILRNPATAGRRMNNSYADESQRKTILTYPGIITWHEHMQIAARLDSRAHRKGISPYNVALLTGVLFDPAGHVLYHVKGRQGRKYYYCRKRCGICPPLEEMDGHISQAVILLYGEKSHRVRRVIPGTNHFEEIARLRQGRAELDDLADDYQERHAELTAEIRRLAKEDKENPKPDEVRWVDSDQTIAEYWLSLTSTVKRHDWLIENEWKVTVSRSGKRWTLTITAGSLGTESITWSPEPTDVTTEPFDIPMTIDDAVTAANVPGELAAAAKWKRSALVRAFCEPSQGQRTDLGAKSQKLSFTQFANRGVTGITNHKTVRRYYDAWTLTGLPDPKPGQTIEIPSGSIGFSAMANRLETSAEGPQ